MEKKAVCEVKKIVIKIEDKEISLTPEQAKKLKGILSEMFGKEIIKEIVKEEHHHYDHWGWYPPVYVQPTPFIPNYPWSITCGGTSVTYDNQQQSINCSL